MKRSRRCGKRLQLVTCAVALLAVLLGFAPPLAAQIWPTQPITWIVPFAAGGPADVVSRIVGEHMSRTLEKEIVFENVVGAGGTTATTRTMRASPDGYTIQMGHMGTHAAAVALYPKLAYKPEVDFAPIGEVVAQPMVLLARKNFPAENLEEFAAYAKANAAKLTMAHAGVGSVSFTCGLLINSIIGVKPNQMPFGGTRPAMNALIGGQVDYLCDSIAGAVPQVLAGTVKAYVVGTTGRNSMLKTVPSAVQAGMPGFQAAPFYGLFAPKGVPRPILDKLTGALDKALDDSGVRRRLFELGCDIPDPSRRGQQPLAALVKREIARWTPIILASGFTRTE
jgi:tripartite-type tricarboxylate transporter receptor subunit TctC